MGHEGVEVWTVAQEKVAVVVVVAAEFGQGFLEAVVGLTWTVSQSPTFRFPVPLVWSPIEVPPGWSYHWRSY